MTNLSPLQAEAVEKIKTTNRVLEDDIKYCGIRAAEHYWNRVGGVREWT
jgi:hypothetical protein